MRKIITLCSLLLALMFVVTMFTACGDKTEDESTTATTTESAIIDSDSFSAVIAEENAIIKKGSDNFQTLSYPLSFENNFDIEYAKNHYEFIEMNFDGKPDFYIAINSKDDVISYYCWIYNESSNSFEFSVILSGLKNISIDSENQVVLSKMVNGNSTNVVTYHWVDGELVLKKAYDSEKESIPEEITKVYEDNAIGTDKPTSSKGDKNETTTKAQSSGGTDKTTKPSTPTKPNKPSNTTTTAPKGNAVVLETGSLNSGGWY